MTAPDTPREAARILPSEDVRLAELRARYWRIADAGLGIFFVVVAYVTIGAWACPAMLTPIADVAWAVFG